MYAYYWFYLIVCIVVQNPFDNIAVRKSIEPLGNFKDTFLIFEEYGDTKLSYIW